MSKEEKNKMVIRLRFPEFKDKGEWEIRELSEFITERNQLPIEKVPLFSLTIDDGITPKTERYERAFLVKNEEEAYKLTYPNDFAYNPMNLRFGAIARHSGYEKVGLSKYYNIFYCDDSVDSTFCEIYFRSYVMINHYNNVATGSLIEKRRVHFSEFIKFKILFPKLSEQQKIASCLSSLDDLITSQSQKLEALKTHKKGLMQQLFPAEGETVPKLRFEEFGECGEWEEKTIGDVAEVITGNTPSTIEPSYYGGKRLFVSPGDISGDRYIIQTKTTLSDEGYSQTRHVKANSILFVCIGSTIGKIAQNKFECATNQQINSVVPNEGNSSDFIYSALENIAQKIAIIAGKQAVPIINKTLFSSVLISFPSPAEQQKIASCLSSLDALMSAQSQKIEALKAHKKGLMQGLFPNVTVGANPTWSPINNINDANEKIQ